MSIPQDLICSNCKRIVMDPYILPCRHSLCLTPCIAPNDRCTEVTCPICRFKCSVKDLTPDDGRCANANAYLLKQSLYPQSPIYSTSEYRQNDDRSAYQRGGILIDDLVQQPRISPRIPSYNDLLPVTQPRECGLCHSMFFGLHYYAAFKLSICAGCRDKKIR